MPSRERRLLDKDKEIRKLKNNLGHYFTNSVVLGIKNEKLKQQLHIAVEALKDVYNCTTGEAFAIAHNAIEEINLLKDDEDAM